VIEMAKILEANPEMEIEEAVAIANGLVDRAKMCFMPDNLEFLRAGGRVSNVAYLGSRILNIHPTIELIDGKLTATKKYRGKMTKAAAQMVKDYADHYDLEKKHIWIVYTVGLSDEVRQSIEAAVKECGFQDATWVLAAGVITTHGGPAAFGLAGFSK
jgi:fatty acid-binding protein DegV